MGKSFNRVGNDLLQILVILIDGEMKRRKNCTPPQSSDDAQSRSTENKNDQSTEGKNNGLNGGNEGSNSTYDIMIRTATKIIGHFARVGKATRPVARFPGFLR